MHSWMRSRSRSGRSVKMRVVEISGGSRMAARTSLLVASLLAILPIGITADAADPPGNTDARLMLMAEMKIVPGKKLKRAAEEYKADNDPKTIELVELPPDDPGSNRVSFDGQVIFFKNARPKQKELSA